MASPFVNTYTSFSGADLVVSIGPNVVGELQQISYGIQREKVPVFTLGSPNPRSFSRGKRGIAGSLVFAIFDKDVLLAAVKAIWDQIAPPAMFTAAGNTAAGMSEDFSTALSLASWNSRAVASAQADYAGTVPGVNDAGTFGTSGKGNIDLGNLQTGSITGSQVYTPPGFGIIQKQNIQYVDQVPPFDVTLTFANEYGQCAFQKIYDLETLNESSGVSVDSVVMEKNYTWIARNISPLVKGIYQRASGGLISGHAAVKNAGTDTGNWTDDPQDANGNYL